MDADKFIFCLEGVSDIENNTATEVVKSLEKLAFNQRVSSIYKTCNTIEGLEESLNTLLYDDHNFKDYEIIYLVMKGEANNICLNNYYYSLQEIAEIFEGKMKGKILHFANSKILDLNQEEAQYFLDITGGRAISSYGTYSNNFTSTGSVDKAFFKLCKEQDDLIEIVETLYENIITFVKYWILGCIIKISSCLGAAIFVFKQNFCPAVRYIFLFKKNKKDAASIRAILEI